MSSRYWGNDYLSLWENQQDEKQTSTVPAQTSPPTPRPIAVALSVPAKPTGHVGQTYTLDAHKRPQCDEKQKQLPEYHSAQKTIQKALEQFLSPKFAEQAGTQVWLALSLKGYISRTE